MPKTKHNRKSPLREIRTGGSVRGLPLVKLSNKR